MTVVKSETLKEVYGLVKRHEADLAQVTHTGHRVERDIFGDLLADTRQMRHELAGALEARRMDLNEIDIPDGPSVITPRTLIDDRKAIKTAYGKALSEYTTQSDVRACLEAHHSQMSGAGQEKLEILCAAILSDQ